jgi:CDP-glycerol glycerophosphotransferase (TagB/SpsB family)
MSKVGEGPPLSRNDGKDLLVWSGTFTEPVKESALVWNALYRVVGAADVLISDVSSVTIDYLVLDRPIVHALADLEEYQRSRGFSVDRIDDLLMGPVATSFDELATVLDQVLAGKDPDADRRRRVRDLSHTDPGPGATSRLLQELGLLPEKRDVSGLDPLPPPPR